MGCSSSSAMKKFVNGSTPNEAEETMLTDADCAPNYPDDNSKDPLNRLLTSDQTIIVRNTWALMSDHAVIIGKKIFLRIFELCPPIKQMFPFKNAWGDELITHPQFQGHACRFMQIITGAIDNLDYLDGYVDTLVSLGRTHAYLPGFKEEHFDVFLSTMMFIWKQELGADFTDETQKSWTILFCFIIDRFKEGYEAQMSKMGKNL